MSLIMCRLSALGTFVLKCLLTNSSLGLVMAMTATILSGITMPLETVMIPLLTNDLFGSASYNKILGIFMAMNALSLCLGPPLGESLRRITDRYRTCFWVFCAILVIVIISFQIVLHTANMTKAAVIAAETTETV